MLSIFAIDPGICQNVEWFRYCVEHCHTARGRAIADLPPGQWCEEALGHINRCVADRQLGPVKGQSVKRRLDMARDRLVHRPGTDWDYMEKSWLPNAENEDRREPFAAIVCPEYNGADHDGRHYHPDDLDESVAAWNTPNGIDITRTAGDFIAAIAPMLAVAEEVHFLDRTFNVDGNSLYTRNYKAMLQTIARRGVAYPAMTIHCCPKESLDINYIETGLNRIYASLIPDREQLTCVVWKTTDNEVKGGTHPFHNRYVLTERCGVMVGYGTDSANVATDAPDTLQIVDHAVFLEKLKHCRKRTHPLLSVRAEIQIQGAG